MGSRGVFQPVGQKRLTNIAVVRLKKGGQRFEIACYKNKVQDWRTGIEKDLDEVLQTTTVFHNVSKGVLAKDKDLQASFGTTDTRVICLEILARGELQVGEEERKQQFDSLFKDVASVLVDKCVNPESGRPYTLALIERALRDVHFNVDPKRSAKQQALEALPLLQERFPIERARMRLKVSVPVEYREDVDDMLTRHAAATEHADEAGGSYSLIAQVEPGVFRELHTFMQAKTHGKGRVEVLNFAVMAEGATAEEFAAAMGAASISAAHHPAPAPTSPAPPAPYHTTAPAPLPVASPSRRPAAPPASGGGMGAGQGGAGGDVVYARGPIASLPEAHASRRERFSELDTLQAGWEVELRAKGDTVEAVFFAPGSGECVGAYANARRAALAASKAAKSAA